jgi:uncharacterized protein (DUF924 family)/Ca2+-binding EF-hand superfamily protein
VLSFWLGPLRDVSSATEEHWRDRMLRWRVGVFARAFEDLAFGEAQRELLQRLHELGMERFFAPREPWETPRGVLAKLIVLDQFPRSVHRGTPLAYESDALTAPMLRDICARGWDLGEHNLIERLWVYVALSHPEDRDLQELSVAKWTQWSTDLIAASPKEHRRVNQRVGWYFVKAVIEHAEAVLLHGKFPHRNPILCRPHRAGEVHYLTSELRPLWSFTQPPRPDYYALHAALHATDRFADCRGFPRETLAAFHRALELDPNDPAQSLMDVFDVLGSERVGFRDLYRHATVPSGAPWLERARKSPLLTRHLQQVTRAIFKDPAATWPPRSARASVPKVIDVPALNLAILCPLLDRGEVYVPRAAIASFVDRTGFAPRPFRELFQRYKSVLAGATATFELTQHGVRRRMPVDRRGFEQLVRPLFSDSPALESVLGTLYELLDLDYDGTVDAGEILVALVALCSGSLEEKLEVCFQIFDADQSGRLDRDELRDLVHTTLLRGLHVVEAIFRSHLPEGTRESVQLVLLFSLANFSAIEESAERALQSADRDGDGMVDEAEFRAWARTHPMLTQLLTLSQALFGV